MNKKFLASLCCLSFLLTGVVFPARAERVNDPLVANDFTKQTPKNTTLNFTIRDFTDSVNPPAGGSLSHITLAQLTNEAAGTLRLGTEPAKAGSAIATDKLDQLNFVPAKDFVGEAIFTWDAHYGTDAVSPYPSAVTIVIGAGQDTPEDPGTPPPTPTPPETPEPPDDTPTQKPLQYEDMLEHWGAYSAGMLGAEGIIVGEEIGGHFYFYPDKVLTRIDFIILANSIFGIKTKDSLAGNPFADTGVPSYMLRQAIAAYENGIIAGTKQNGQLYLNPYDKLTRAEAAKILDNGLALEHPATEPLSFADSASIPTWAEQAVKNMEAYGIVKGYSDNTFRPYGIITKAQAAELLYQTFKYQNHARKTQSVFNKVFYGSK
ncbi:MAG: S-layer homology domain-containing protein [Ruminococcaceae bacterium]|nr:S-layer homology domain-containing protein [Oscillospiraceae bacterium]